MLATLITAALAGLAPTQVQVKPGLTERTMLGEASTTSMVEPRAAPMAHVIVDRGLVLRSVFLGSVDDTAATVFRGQGMAEAVPLDNVLLITPDFGLLLPPPAALLGPAGVADGLPDAIVETTDGQRLALELGPPAGRDLTGRLDAGVDLALPLDRVRRVVFAAAGLTPPRDPSTDDVVLLANGDVLTGFVESIGSVVTIDLASGPLEVPVDRVASVTIAADPEPPARLLLATYDGLIVAVESMRATGERLDVWPADAVDPAATLMLSCRRVAGLYRRDDAARAAPLAPVAVTGVRPSPSRRTTEAPLGLGADQAIAGFGDIEISGPLSGDWPVPAGVTRFATEAMLARGDWANCELRVEALSPAGAATPLWAARLTPDAPGATCNALVPPGTSALRIILDEGDLGPVHDRVTLRRPRVLVETGTDNAAP